MVQIVSRCPAVASSATFAVRFSTVPASATCWPTAACPGVVTTVVSDPVGGWSNRPNRNISVRIRDTMPFSVAIDLDGDPVTLRGWRWPAVGGCPAGGRGRPGRPRAGRAGHRVR
jgi:hypothetical protein